MSFEKKAEELLVQGARSLELGELDSAIKSLTLSLSYAGKAEAYLLRSKAYLQRKDYDNAGDDVERGLALCVGGSRNKTFKELTQLKDVIATESARDKLLRQWNKSAARGGDIHHFPFGEFLERNVAPSLRMQLQSGNGSGAGVCSQCGGSPKVPKSFEWPRTSKGRPLEFLLQIHLEDLEEFSEISSLLPKRGVLLFFYNSVDQPWGYDPNDADSWRVYYFPDVEELVETEAPEDSEETLDSIHISWSEELSYPDTASEDTETLAEDEVEQYETFLEDHYQSEPTHRLLGYPQFVQGDWRVECQLASSGIYCGDDSPEIARERERQLEQSKSWILLLQLDSDDELGYMWGDGGRIYFCIRKEDLAAVDFSRCWVVLQCY
jgi:uncharacterized protein YwqG